MDDDADAKTILTAPRPPGNWKRPPEGVLITWLNTVQRDLSAYSLALNEAVDLAHAEPSSVEADVYARHYALLVVHARKEEVQMLEQLLVGHRCGFKTTLAPLSYFRVFNTPGNCLAVLDHLSLMYATVLVCQHFV